MEESHYSSKELGRIARRFKATLRKSNQTLAIPKDSHFNSGYVVGVTDTRGVRLGVVEILGPDETFPIHWMRL